MSEYRTRDLMRAATLWIETGGQLDGTGMNMQKEPENWQGMELDSEGKVAFVFKEKKACERILKRYTDHAIIADIYTFSQAYFYLRRKLNIFLHKQNT